MTQLDVQYGTGLLNGGSKQLLMDIYQSGDPCTDPRPFIVMIHGGGFIGGSKSDLPWRINAEEMASRGFVAASIDYRLEGDDPVPSAEFTPVLQALFQTPEGMIPSNEMRVNAIASAFEDAANAVRYLIDEADTLCIDPDRYGIWGSSAGAFIALHTAYGLDEFSITLPKPNVVGDFWGGVFFPEILDQDDPPFIIVHGDQDPTVQYQQSVNLAARATMLNVDHSFYTVENAGHGFGATQVASLEVGGETLIDLTYNFLEAHLRAGGTPLYETFSTPRSP